MIGAIAGDIIGSVYEWANIKTTEFLLFKPESHFTDDSVLTIAVADSILSGVGYTQKLKEYYQIYPQVGYGSSFRQWAESANDQPYNSWGNGSAMRVSPVGFAYSSLPEVLREAAASAMVTHNHPEGIKGAQATAAAIFLARTGQSKAQIQAYITATFGYQLAQPLAEIRPNYQFDVSCQGSVPQAIRAFLESNSYEDAIRKAISLGGDSDTIACITGGIAQAYYQEIPRDIIIQARGRLDERLKQVLDKFNSRFGY